jgi:hypothetical protein
MIHNQKVNPSLASIKDALVKNVFESLRAGRLNGRSRSDFFEHPKSESSNSIHFDSTLLFQASDLEAQ